MGPDGIKGFYSGGTAPVEPKIPVRAWVAFNKKLLNLDDVIVKVFRGRNLHVDNCLMTTTMKIDDMVTVFGDYTIIKFGVDSYTTDCNFDRSTLKFLICKEEV